MRPVHQFANRCVAPNVAIGVRNVVRSVRNVPGAGARRPYPTSEARSGAPTRGPLRARSWVRGA